MRRPAKIILVAGIAVAIASAAYVHFAFGGEDEIQRGLHLARVDWLPADASDVTYAKREGFGWFICYECRISKAGLDRIAAKKEWKLELKSDVRIEFFRRELSSVAPEKNAESKGVITVDLSHEPSQPTVQKALFYESR